MHQDVMPLTILELKVKLIHTNRLAKSNLGPYIKVVI